MLDEDDAKTARKTERIALLLDLAQQLRMKGKTQDNVWDYIRESGPGLGFPLIESEEYIAQQ